MTNSGLIVFLPLVGAILGGIVGAVGGAWANSWYRDREAKKVENRERDGLLLLLHGDLHHNDFLLTTLIERSDWATDPAFTNFQTEVWTNARLRLTQMLPRPHLAALVMYHTRLSDLMAEIHGMIDVPPEAAAENLSDSALAAREYGQSAMRFGIEYIFDDPRFEPAINDPFGRKDDRPTGPAEGN